MLLNAVTIGVSDLTRSKSFYESLGFEVEKEFPGFISFKSGDGGVVLGLYPKEGLAQLVGLPLKADKGFTGFKLDYNATARERVDEVIGLARKAGAEVIKEAHDADWGGRVGRFSDPDGYVWQVTGS